MRFGSESLLWLTALFPALGLFFLWAFRRRAAILRRFAAQAMLARMVQGTSRPRQALKAGLLALGVLFLALSLARPQWGTRMEMMKRRGLDVVIAVDVSLSMFAEDIKPNRMARSKQEISKFIDRLAGDRVALVAFAGDAYLQCPLTSDYAAFRIFLDVLEPDLIEVPGTDIARALEVSLSAFDERDRKYRVVVLLTDGEDHSGRAEKAAKEMADQGVIVYTVGIGSLSGVPIPVKGAGGAVSYKKDANGQVVTTRLDAQLLQRIALATDGGFYHARPAEFELAQVLEAINAMEKRELESEQFTRYEERFQIPLAIAVLLLALEMFVSDRRKRRSEWKGRFS